MTAHGPRLPDQVRTPNYAGANYNRIQFTPVETTTIRVTFTPQAGMAVGVKEIEAYNTGIKADGTSENQTPQVDAYVSSSTSSGAKLVGTVKDDGLPAEGDNHHHMVAGLRSEGLFLRSSWTPPLPAPPSPSTRRVTTS